MLRVVVTGARGLLGSYIADALAGHSHIEVVQFVRAGTAQVGDTPEHGVDLTDERQTEAALAAVKPDAVIHAAGRVHGTPLQLFRDNTVTTVVLANAMLRACQSAVLSVLGSAAEYGRPRSEKRISEDHPCRPVGSYGHAKLAAANYLSAAAQHGLRYNLVRVFNPVGEVNSSDQVLGAFIAKAVKLFDAPPPRTIAMGRLDAIRDFIAMKDLLKLIEQLLEGRISGELVNACSGEGYRIRELIQFLVNTSKREFNIVEQGQPPMQGHEDIIIGDPTRFFALSGLTTPTPIWETLSGAWLRAVADNDTEENQAVVTSGQSAAN